jgi:hypothetical protein
LVKDEMDELVRHIYAEREEDEGRPVDPSHLLDD